jgi:hypothetical protein
MPRKLRVEYPGAIYHVMSRGDHANLVSGMAWLQSTYTIRLTTATSSRGTF